eukprot:4756983-Amphidinium_carterae.1
MAFYSTVYLFANCYRTNKTRMTCGTSTHMSRLTMCLLKLLEAVVDSNASADLVVIWVQVSLEPFRSPCCSVILRFVTILHRRTERVEKQFQFAATSIEHDWKRYQ